jgi:hypothetical protein
MYDGRDICEPLDLNGRGDKLTRSLVECWIYGKLCKVESVPQI